VLTVLEGSNLTDTRRRDLAFAVRRICTLAGVSPAAVATDVGVVRRLIADIRPAAHHLSPKSWSNLRSVFAGALALAGVIDPSPRGQAMAHPVWGPLVARLPDKRTENGLAAFLNWCALNNVAPDAVDDETIGRFQLWLETRTLHPKPHDVVRRTPNLWNEARNRVSGRPTTELSPRSFRKPPQHFNWSEFPTSLLAEVEAYIDLRREPDIFAAEGSVPRRPLAAFTLRQQREHLRIAASHVARKIGEVGGGGEQLADLVTPEAFKSVLRHFYERAQGNPNAFAIAIAKTLIDVARFQVGVSSGDLSELKRLASKLPAVPLELTARNKALLADLESDRVRAKLYRLPEEALEEVARNLDAPRFPGLSLMVSRITWLPPPLLPAKYSKVDHNRPLADPEDQQHIPASNGQIRARSACGSEICHSLPCCSIATDHSTQACHKLNFLVVSFIESDQFHDSLFGPKQ